VCSNDPICADHEPSSTADDRAVYGAACHGCLLIAETSCEARNLFLDRSLLVETMTARQSAFFQPTIYEEHPMPPNGVSLLTLCLPLRQSRLACFV
jgi:hypothetical protein